MLVLFYTTKVRFSYLAIYFYTTTFTSNMSNATYAAPATMAEDASVFTINKANNSGNNLDKYEPIIHSSPKKEETCSHCFNPNRFSPVKYWFVGATYPHVNNPNRNEFEILENLTNKLAKTKTIIIISHRINTLKNFCDNNILRL